MMKPSESENLSVTLSPVELCIKEQVVTTKDSCVRFYRLMVAHSHGARILRV